MVIFPHTINSSYYTQWYEFVKYIGHIESFLSFPKPVMIHIFKGEGEQRMTPQLLLGIRIQSLRKQKQLTQEQLAEKMNSSVHYISSLERGIGNPTLNLFLKLANALEVGLWELFVFDHHVEKKELRKVYKQLAANMDDKQLQLAVKVIQAMIR